MALLKFRQLKPPGGWIYFQAETQFTIKAENLDALVALVIAHRQYKNLQPQDPPSVELEIQRQLCVRLGRLECKSEGNKDGWVPQDNLKEFVTMSGVLSFSKAAIAFVKSGGAMATPEESQRRAAICMACPMNQPMSGCSCGVFYKILDATVPRARKIDGLHVCRACQCSLGVKVLLTDEQIVVSNEGRKINWPSQECWQRRIMEDHAAAAPIE